jgi:hypothetical protein
MKIQKTKVKTAKKKDEFKSLTDENGNQLIIKSNNVRLILYLKLKAETKSRKLGVVNLEQKVFEVTRNRAKHLFRKNQSYGFNHKLLDEAKLFDNVRLKDDIQEWLIPKSYILENGNFLHFKNNGGFERQIFIELDKIQEFSRPKKI